MQITIAIDAMGGDYGPDVTVPASIEALKQHQELKLLLVGPIDTLKTKIKQCLAKEVLASTIQDRLIVQHASEQVAMDEPPSKALRGKKDSSMRVAINLVKNNLAQACVSAGNTGALMATAHFVLKTLPGIDRSAIISSLPTMNLDKQVRILDLGANVESDASHLYQFAVMGSVLVSATENIERPKIGLLNVGSEPIKGSSQVKEASLLLAKNKNLNYIGYVEGDDIFKGVVDVIVCDGFIGNIALKTMEGLIKMMACYLKRAFTKNIFTKIAAIIAMPVLKKLAKELDPGRRNGASLIGLQGIVIKSHGGANIPAFTHAIHEAILEVANNIPQKIRGEVSKLLGEQATP